MEELLKDLYKSERQHNQKLMIFNYILIAFCAILLSICVFLVYELSTYEQVEITTTTETYDQDIEGDDASIVNGNQYNDSATHNEGSGMNGESTSESNQDQNDSHILQEEE